MKVEHAPDAYQSGAMIGPRMQTMHFRMLGDVTSVSCSDFIVGRTAGEQLGDWAFISMALKAPGGAILAFHLNADADTARKVGAALIDAANELAGAAGVQ
jgi:hypothetical protein